MSVFLNAFWPNLASTIIGVALGIPIALYLNRKLTKQSRLGEASRHAVLLASAIKVLFESFDYNIFVLHRIVELSADGEIMRNPDLRTTTWENLAGIMTSHLENPELLQLLSHHWLRLRRLEELNAQTFAMQIGQLPLPQGDVSLGCFIGELHFAANDLAMHAMELSTKLRAVSDKGTV